MQEMLESTTQRRQDSDLGGYSKETGNEGKQDGEERQIQVHGKGSGKVLTAEQSISNKDSNSVEQCARPNGDNNCRNGGRKPIWGTTNAVAGWKGES